MSRVPVRQPSLMSTITLKITEVNESLCEVKGG